MKSAIRSLAIRRLAAERSVGSLAPLFGKCSIAILACSLMASCAPFSTPLGRNSDSHTALELYDNTRARTIPILIYGARYRQPRPLAIILPGYGIGNSEYSFIARELVARGYVVAAIQIQLASDPPVPSGDNLKVRRLPHWRRGVADVQFAVNALKLLGFVKAAPLIAVGHSHGGDVAMLLATEYPTDIHVVFSLDNRRMPMPLSKQPRICSARSSDQLADPGVLPSPAQQAALNMSIKELKGVRHDDMLDTATDVQKKAILAVLRDCLRQN